ncbi:Protein CBG22736 [Caenorhabditis briggsae]|uniref:Protein CBG22736 n=1 Tax=Caenorhabditis briggsae TaxID=6238 RepID=A8Y323_CAEBR|nr:Protein CBG22736 [Caenorhabditis briggsae]CAP39260.2 Protein CBG22736 [Caenorhabditis briggsae]
MRFFTIATIAIAFVVASDNITSTFGDIDDSSSDDFSSDETITSINLNAQTLVEDAHQQEDQRLQCWEPVDPVNATRGFILSKPIFTLSSYITLINSEGNDFASFAVNGLESEYYDPLLLVFEDSEKDSEEDYEAIVICAIEKLQLLKPPLSPSTAMRCLCNESGCNVPKPLEEFLKFNRNVIETNKNTDLSDHMPIPNDFSP